MITPADVRRTYKTRRRHTPVFEGSWRRNQEEEDEDGIKGGEEDDDDVTLIQNGPTGIAFLFWFE